MEDIDLGMCGGQLFAADPGRVAILLPGARYVPAAPLLWFAREALQGHDWTVLQVWDEWDRSVDSRQWVADRFQAALLASAAATTRLVVAKSLTTFALPAAVDLALPGVWLTPLLNQDDIRSALANSAAPTLAVGGTADPTWDSKFVTSLPNIEVVEIPEADHGLQHPGKPSESIDALGVITERIGDFASRLA